MTLTMTRAGHYEAWDDDRLLGRISGDHVIGFRATLPDGTVLREVFDDPAAAAWHLRQPGAQEPTA